VFVEVNISHDGVWCLYTIYLPVATHGHDPSYKINCVSTILSTRPI
jgi:hypothetical protein